MNSEVSKMTASIYDTNKKGSSLDALGGEPPCMATYGHDLFLILQKVQPPKVRLQGFGGNLVEAAAGGISVISSFNHGLSVTILGPRPS